MWSSIQPHDWVGLRLPSGTLKILRVVPNTTISIGKFGAFYANQILDRPYHLTFEIIAGDDGRSSLRLVPAAELNAIATTSESQSEGDGSGTPFQVPDGVEYEVVDADGKVVMRTNKDILDTNTSQKLSAAEIESLKREDASSGRDVINAIISSHSSLDKKTAFALAKYTLRKSKKFLRRFSVLPLDVPLLREYLMTEKEPKQILELREEILALIGSWSNVHCARVVDAGFAGDGLATKSGRWLVVDDTGGLLVAAMAERMGLLHASTADPSSLESNGSAVLEQDVPESPSASLKTFSSQTQGMARTRAQESSMSARSNTLTLVHTNTQPNLSLLTYFNFDFNNASPSHPLHTHLKTLSWLQLISPESESGYIEPEVVPPEVLQTYKSGKKANYFRKRRRWARIKTVVDETRAGGFDGLVVASFMDPSSVLHHLIPLTRGGAQVVVYSPHVEPLAEVVDYYSTARRIAFLTNRPRDDDFPNEDFPLDPTLLLGPTIYTARARQWQTLPGRTHPLMTGRGGAEGFVFTATRVLPAEGKVEARGMGKRKRGNPDLDVSMDSTVSRD